MGGRARKLGAAAVVAVFSAVPASSAQAVVGPHSGCDSNRPALAYHPGGSAISPQPSGAPVPCTAVFGERTSESATVAVTNSGRILYAPTVENSYPAPLDDRGPARVVASDDGGASWQHLDSGGDGHILDVPPWMWRDPDTHRIWFASVLPPLCGAEISWSDDDGRTWQTNPAVGCPGMGSMRTLEGPAPAGGAKPSGYAHVVYYCANLNDFEQSNLWCFRSLDGGRSFAFTGSFPDPTPPPGCNTRHPARPGTVGPDGVLYFPVFVCGDLSVAISRDEGATWQLVPVTNTDVQDLYITSMAADRAGNLYLAWINGTGGSSTEAILGQGIPTLSVSRDHGQTWSHPAAIGPPGMKDARHIAIDATGTGKLAVSFLGNTDGGPNLDGYLAETYDALAPDPVWWAAPLNNPVRPLISTSDSETFGDRLFFFTDTFAPDGEPWAAFHCAKTSMCPGQRIGIVGRLAPASAANASTPAAPKCADTRKFTFKLHHARRARIVRVQVFLDGKRILSRRGRNIRSVTIRRLPQRVFHLKIVSTQSSGSKIVSRRTYRGCTKSRPTTRGHHHHPSTSR